MSKKTNGNSGRRLTVLLGLLLLATCVLVATLWFFNHTIQTQGETPSAPQTVVSSKPTTERFHNIPEWGVKVGETGTNMTYTLRTKIDDTPAQEIVFVSDETKAGKIKVQPGCDEVNHGTTGDQQTVGIVRVPLGYKHPYYSQNAAIYRYGDYDYYLDRSVLQSYCITTDQARHDYDSLVDAVKDLQRI